MIPLRLQIQEVKRLIRMREAAWPGLVGIVRANPEDDEHLERMRAVLETLERLEAEDLPDWDASP